MVYPDIETNVVEPPDAAETAFRALPVIAEKLLQSLSDGALPANNPFSALLGSMFSGRPYNETALDSDLYDLKAELDPILVREGKVKFSVPQLMDILASEIQSARDTGYPLLAEQAIAATANKAAVSALVVAGDGSVPIDGSAGDLSGWGALGAAPAAPDMGVIVLKATGLYSDSMMNAMQYVSPYLSLALQVAFNIVLGAVSVVQVALTGFSAGSGAAPILFAAGQSLTLTAEAISAAASASVVGIAVAMGTQILLQFVMLYMKCVSAEAVRKRIVRELTALAAQIEASMAEMVAKVAESVDAQKANTAKALAQFRDVTGEMVARVLNGEKIIGLLSCKSDGTMVMEFGLRNPVATEAAVGGAGGSGGSGGAGGGGAFASLTQGKAPYVIAAGLLGLGLAMRGRR